MKKKIPALIKYLWLAVPLVLGFVGYYVVDGQPFLQSVYISTKMYGFGATDLPPNWVIELARWLGPVVTASGVIMAFRYLRRGFLNKAAYLKGKSTAVYGPEEARKVVLKQLGRSGVEGTGRFVKAHRYILLGGEEENLAFFGRNKEKIAGRDVYALCDALSAQSVASHNLHLFCPEEIAASIFWKKHCLYPLVKEKGGRLDVVFIGFGKLGRELLLSALQNNIFFPDQRVVYHVFGEEEGFLKIHHQLGRVGDGIVFHAQPWYEEVGLINRADRVVVLEQEGQAQLLRRLTLAAEAKTIYVFSALDYSMELLADHEKLVAFPWKKEAAALENILETELFQKAKRLNLRYAHIYNGVEETAENARREWQKMDTFTRYSNISAADYNDIQRTMTETAGVPEGAELEKLAELEHIRWMRYHYIHNWKQGKVESGTKDPENRIHADLVPYEELSESEKEKDRENVRILFSLA